MELYVPFITGFIQNARWKDMQNNKFHSRTLVIGTCTSLAYYGLSNCLIHIFARFGIINYSYIAAIYISSTILFKYFNIKPWSIFMKCMTISINYVITKMGYDNISFPMKLQFEDD